MAKWETQKERLLINNNNRYVGGDILDATSLNAVITETIISFDLLEVLFGEDFISIMLSGFQSIVWMQDQSASLKESTIDINLATVPLYAEIKCDDLIKGSVSNSSDKIIITITETIKLHQSGTKMHEFFEYTVAFYSDEQKQRKIHEKTGKIMYIYMPTTPGVD